jgi:hypothetical protein
VDGRRHVVKVIDGGAVEEGRGGRKLLRIKITAEVDGVRRGLPMAGMEMTMRLGTLPTPAPRRREAERQTPGDSPP